MAQEWSRPQPAALSRQTAARRRRTSDGGGVRCVQLGPQPPVDACQQEDGDQGAQRARQQPRRPRVGAGCRPGQLGWRSEATSHAGQQASQAAGLSRPRQLTCAVSQKHAQSKPPWRARARAPQEQHRPHAAAPLAGAAAGCGRRQQRCSCGIILAAQLRGIVGVGKGGSHCSLASAGAGRCRVVTAVVCCAGGGQQAAR